MTEKLLYSKQGVLPSLPVPTLEDTAAKLLKSVRALASSDDEYTHAEAVVSEFVSGIGKELQEALVDRASEQRNWLEEWWEEFIYLRPRWPIAVWINWQGTSPNLDWEPWKLSQTESAALSIVHTLKFRHLLVSETLPPETLSGQPLCMYQYERMYNSCRVPGEECDTIQVYSKDKRHIVVLRNNRIMQVEVLDESGAIKSVSDIILQLDECIALSSNPFDLDVHPPVSVLTSQDRTVWAKARQHLIDSDALNRSSLESIETALFCVALDRDSPRSLEERSSAALLGTGLNRWYDKPFTVIVYSNGLSSINGEHSWADAMVVVKQQDFVMKSVADELKVCGRPVVSSPSAAYCKPNVLPWKFDAASIQAIELASSSVRLLIRKFDLRVLSFPHFGRLFCKRIKVTPDFFMQMAIQLAYWRLHGKAVATYETAHTRLFYHGRTETTRSTSIETVAFCKSMSNPSVADGERYRLLMAAIDAHASYIKDAMMGKGIDRHLLGLQIVAEIRGLKPALFSETLFARSRKFFVSTSNVSTGNSATFGGFAPFFDGAYGVCYGIQDHAMNVCLTHCVGGETDVTKLRDALETALIDLQGLCLTRDIAYMQAKL